MKFFAGIALLLLFAACNNNGEEKNVDPSLVSPPVADIPNIPYTIIAEHPHDRDAYTQGLELFNGKMYEGTGDYEKSALRITDHKTGNVEKNHVIGSDKIFGEGITIFKNKIYQLTWESNIVYVYDVKDITKPIKTFNWPYQGWGLTHNDSELIVSTGEPSIYFVNPDDFKVKRILPVTDNRGPVYDLNELELINGYLYANVYETDKIAKIDTATGKVVGYINFAGVIGKSAPDFHPVEKDEVLNGIAYDSASKTLFITGKRWPKMFEVKLQ